MTHQEPNESCSIHHRHALRACWPYLKRSSQSILDIGPDPLPWLRTLERCCDSAHKMAGCVQNADTAEVSESSPYLMTAVELDIWSPLARKGLPAQLPHGDYTLITALNLIDHLYHPEPFIKAVAQVLRPGGVLLLTGANISARKNLLGLLRGDGVAPDLDAVVGLKRGPRPRVRQYSWREIANLALSHNFVPVRHGFYEGDDTFSLRQHSAFGIQHSTLARPLPNPPPEYRGREPKELPPTCCRWLLAHPHQLRSHFYLLLARTANLPGHRFSGYMLRHATRATLRFSRNRIAAQIRAMASA